MEGAVLLDKIEGAFVATVFIRLIGVPIWGIKSDGLEKGFSVEGKGAQ